MNTLIRTEWLKMKKYNAFWWILGLTALSYPGINLIFHFFYQGVINDNNTVSKLAKAAVPNPFAYPDVWNTVAYASSCFVFIPAVLVIMFISNEYTYKTHRQNIIDGWSRSQFVTSKLVDVLIITLIITLLNILVTFLTGFMNMPDSAGKPIWSKAYVVGLFALQTFSQLSIAFLIGFLVRKAFLGLGVFIFYFIIVENILVNVFSKYVDDIGRFLPFEMSDRMICNPLLQLVKPDDYATFMSNRWIFILLTILLTTITWGICYRINSKRDLK
ncbi:MAG: ABC transporter permease [Bacteroidetes bacterium]|nr:ABC transporter permease [Bacteroidota bacterium]